MNKSFRIAVAVLGLLCLPAVAEEAAKGQVKLETTCYDKDNTIVHVNISTQVTIALDKDKGENTIKKCVILIK